MADTKTVKLDPNRGPIKLDHDPNPRDLTKTNPSVDDLEDSSDFRIKGYATQNFFSPRMPPPAMKDSGSSGNDDTKTFHKTNVFDSNRPRLDEGHTGLQYNGTDQPELPPGPRPIRDPFNHRTSAELKRYHLQQQIAEDDIKKFKEEKLNKLREREIEKKQDLEMLTSYNPWGKPGGGAPANAEVSPPHQRRKFTEEAVSAEKEPPDQKGQGDQTNYNSNFGKQGAGAPLRTDSGNVKTELRSDPLIRFQDTEKARQVVDTDIRYKALPEETKRHYSQELQRQIYERAMAEQEVRMKELKNEMNMLKDYDPYGRPGAGAPNKTHSDNEMLGRQTTLTNNLEERRRSSYKENAVQRKSDSNFKFFDPWGKGTGQPYRDTEGNVMRYKITDRDMGVYTVDNSDPKLGVSLSVGGAEGSGAPLRTDSGQVRSRLPITMSKDDFGEQVIREDVPSPRRVGVTPKPTFQIYDPWGKAGSGAPLFDQGGHIKTHVYGSLQNENMADEERKKLAAGPLYLNELQREIEEQRYTKDMMDHTLKYGEGELATVLKRGQVGKPRRDPDTGMLLNQHLPQTDVTRQKNNSRSQKNAESSLYHTELEQMSEERRRVHELDRLKERQESKQHAHVFNDLWGRPGGGAPNIKGLRKYRLDDMLYTPRESPALYAKHVENKADFYSGDGEPKVYTRSTIDSKHTNLYEYEVAKSDRQRDYKLYAPYALN